jgi:hypothetical protein
MTYFGVATHKLRSPVLNICEAEKCSKPELKIHAVILSRASAVEHTKTLLYKTLIRPVLTYIWGRDMGAV